MVQLKSELGHEVQYFQAWNGPAHSCHGHHGQMGGALILSAHPVLPRALRTAALSTDFGNPSELLSLRRVTIKIFPTVFQVNT